MPPFCRVRLLTGDEHAHSFCRCFEKTQSRSQSPRYPYPAERETRDSGTKQFRMTRFLSWVQLRRRKRLDKMATNAEKVFHDGIEFSVAKLGNSNLELIAWRKEIY